MVGRLFAGGASVAAAVLVCASAVPMAQAADYGLIGAEASMWYTNSATNSTNGAVPVPPMWGAAGSDGQSSGTAPVTVGYNYPNVGFPTSGQGGFDAWSASAYAHADPAGGTLKAAAAASTSTRPISSLDPYFHFDAVTTAHASVAVGDRITVDRPTTVYLKGRIHGDMNAFDSDGDESRLASVYFYIGLALNTFVGENPYNVLGKYEYNNIAWSGRPNGERVEYFRVPVVLPEAGTYYLYSSLETFTDSVTAWSSYTPASGGGLATHEEHWETASVDFGHTIGFTVEIPEDVQYSTSGGVGINLPIAVPEPGTAGLLAAAATAAGLRRRHAR